MRISVLPDLHMEMLTKQAAQKAAKLVAKDLPDVLILAGDVGCPLKNFCTALDVFSESAKTVAVLAGNHDLWHTIFSAIGSEELWSLRLPEETRKRKMAWLEDGFVSDGETAVVGSVAWYDYSARDTAFSSMSDEYFAETKGEYNNDGNYIDWQRSDVQFSEHVRNALCGRIAKLNDDASIKSIFVATHVPVFPEQRGFPQSFGARGSEYFGNWTLGRELEKFDKIAAIASGHTHIGKKSEHLCRDGRVVPCSVIGSDYGKPKHETFEIGGRGGKIRIVEDE